MAIKETDNTTKYTNFAIVIKSSAYYTITVSDRNIKQQ